MTVVHLLNALQKHFNSPTSESLALELHCDPAVVSRMRKRNQGASPTFILRCYDHAGFSIERIRELLAEPDCGSLKLLKE